MLNHVDGFEHGVHDECYNRYDYFSEKLDAVTRWEQELKMPLEENGTTGKREEEGRRGAALLKDVKV